MGANINVPLEPLEKKSTNTRKFLIMFQVVESILITFQCRLSLMISLNQIVHLENCEKSSIIIIRGIRVETFT